MDQQSEGGARLGALGLDGLRGGPETPGGSRAAPRRKGATAVSEWISALLEWLFPSSVRRFRVPSVRLHAVPPTSALMSRTTSLGSKEGSAEKLVPGRAATAKASAMRQLNPLRKRDVLDPSPT